MLCTYSYNNKNIYLKKNNIGFTLPKQNTFVTLRSHCLYPAAYFDKYNGIIGL